MREVSARNALLTVALGLMVGAASVWAIGTVGASTVLGTVAGFMLVVALTRVSPGYSVATFPLMAVAWKPLQVLVLASKEFHFTVADAALAIMILMAGFRIAVSQRESSLSHRIRRALSVVGYTWLLPVPLVIANLVALSPVTVVTDLIVFAKRMGEYCLLVVVVSALLNRDDMGRMLGGVLAAGAIVSLLGIAEATSTGGRAASLLQYSNNLGLYSAVVFNVGIACIATPLMNGAMRVVAFACSLLAVGSLLASGSRAASLGFIASVGYWLCIKWPTRGKQAMLLAAVASVVALVLSGLMPSSLLNRWEEVALYGSETFQVASRLYAGKIGLRIFLDHILVGVGTARLPSYSVGLVDSTTEHLTGDAVHNVGNQFLQVAVETGLVGVVLTLLWLGKLLALVSSCSNDVTLWAPSRALGGILVTLLGAGVGMHTFYVPQVMAIVWILVGLLHLREDEPVENRVC